MPLPHPRFSLLTLLFLTTIVAMGVALWRLNSELAPLRVEVRKLRDETGVLTVEDNTRPHAIDGSTGERDHWRWRVFIPQKGRYSVYFDSGYIPKEGIPKLTGARQSITMSPGEYRIDAWIKPSKRNHKTLEASVRMSSVGTTSTMITLQERNHDWIDNESPEGSSFLASTGGGRTRSFEPQEPMVLLRLRAAIPISQPSGSGNTLWTIDEITEPCEGLMIWVDQTK